MHGGKQMKEKELIFEETEYLRGRLEDLGYNNTYMAEQKILSRLLVLALNQPVENK